MNRKLIIKSRRFVPFDANLKHFGTKPDIPGVIYLSSVSVWVYTTCVHMSTIPAESEMFSSTSSDQLAGSIYFMCVLCIFGQNFRFNKIKLCHARNNKNTMFFFYYFLHFLTNTIGQTCKIWVPWCTDLTPKIGNFF